MILLTLLTRSKSVYELQKLQIKRLFPAFTIPSHYLMLLMEALCSTSLVPLPPATPHTLPQDTNVFFLTTCLDNDFRKGKICKFSASSSLFSCNKLSMWKVMHIHRQCKTSNIYCKQLSRQKCNTRSLPSTFNSLPQQIGHLFLLMIMLSDTLKSLCTVS